MEVTAARRSFLCDIGFWADRTALHEAASHGRALQLKQLIEDGASVNMVTVDNITPLHEACIQAHPNCARLLLEAGAQVDVRTIHGSTPLCNACSSGSLECAKLLLDYGAKVNPSLTALTASPLHEACIQATRGTIFCNSETRLELHSGDAVGKKSLLMNHSDGNIELVRLMIASGAHLEAYDVHFGPPLHIACAKGRSECVRELLSAGANVNSAKFHETALHHAARVDMVDMVELLVEFGANVYSSDNLGRKPIDYTKPASPSYTCLSFYESNPLSLQQLCRITVRTMLGVRASEVIGQLDISNRILHYLHYRDLPTSLHNCT